MNLLNFLKKWQAPVDIPGAIVPLAVINRFRLLNRLPELIGLDLRQVTFENMAPTEIGLFKAIDGTTFAGQAFVHKNYFVSAEAGMDINDRRYWVIDVFANNVDLAFMQELCQQLYRVYGSPYVSYGAGKFTAKDLMDSQAPRASLKCWQDLQFDKPYLKYCRLWLRTYEYGRIANLHYHVFDQ